MGEQRTKGRPYSRRLMAVAAAGMLLFACNTGSNAGPSTSDAGPCRGAATPALAIQCLEEAGAIPVLDRSDDVAGPDADHNGIRDDIDAYIAKQGYTPSQLAAVQQLARTFQASLVAGAAGGPDAAGTIGWQFERAIHCVFDRFRAADPSDHSGAELATGTIDKYRQLTANTSQRVQAYFRFNHAMNGAVSSTPQGDSCDK